MHKSTVLRQQSQKLPGVLYVHPKRPYKPIVHANTRNGLLRDFVTGGHFRSTRNSASINEIRKLARTLWF